MAANKKGHPTATVQLLKKDDVGWVFEALFDSAVMIGEKSAITKTQRNNIKYGSTSRNERSRNGEDVGKVKLTGEDGKNGGHDRTETTETRSDTIRNVSDSGTGKMKYSKQG